MTDYIPLSAGDIALAAVFLLFNAGLSLSLQLGLERKLLISAARMVVQLLLVGLVLKTVFSLGSPWFTLLIAVVMLGFAAREIAARQNRQLAGTWGYSLGAGAMMTSAALVTVFALTAQIRPDPWWSPQFALPLFGMILGNTMTGGETAAQRVPHDGAQRLHTRRAQQQPRLDCALFPEGRAR